MSVADYVSPLELAPPIARAAFEQRSATAPPLTGPTKTQAEAPTQLEGVVVTARRGAAREAPEREFGEGDIDALGAADIGEVIDRLNDTAGGRGPPIIIVNGRRVADSSVFLPFPPDALTRVEVLPPSSSATYGSSDPSRRVFNIVLQQRFEGRDAVLSATRPTTGGAATDASDLRRSRIVGMDTSQVGARFSRDTSIRAGERPDYLSDHPGSRSTTLRPQSERLTADLTITRAIGEWRGSLGAGAQSQSSRFVSDADGQDVHNHTTRRDLNLTGGLSGDVAGWTLRASAGAQASRTDVSGLSPARSDNRSVNLNLSVSRGLLTLPAGPVFADLSGQVSRSRTASKQEVSQRRFLGRSEEVGAQISIPISRSTSSDGDDRRFGLGDLSISLRASSRSTDAGRGENFNAGLYWTPVRALSFNGAWSRSTDAPTDEQRFAPAVYGIPTVVFDFRTGQSVEISPLTGGNPDLRTARRDTQMVGVSMGPFTPWRLSGGLNFRRSDATNESGSLPGPTSDIEAAFPERFQRDAEGRLVGIDQQPISIALITADVLASNLSAFIPLGRAVGPKSSSIQISLNHTWRFGDSTLIRLGLPRMDRLSGDGGGVSREELALRLDGRRGPWGFGAAANWRSDYRVRRDAGRDSPGDLKVEAFGTMNLQLSYAIQRSTSDRSAASAVPTRRNTALTLAVDFDNLFDARPRARLGDGRPAPGYGRNDRDPVGRLIRIAVTNRF